MNNIPVIFRKWKNDGQIIALFPTILANLDGMITAYGWDGHSAADYSNVIRRTVAAKPSEYIDLYRKLNRIGYVNLKVYKRRPQHKG